MRSDLMHLRQLANLSRLEAAKRLDVDQSALYRWEIGDRDPAARYVRLMATLYGSSCDMILAALDRVQRDRAAAKATDPAR